MATQLTQEDVQLFEEAARTHSLNAFTSHYFQLPFSGTRYTPEDRAEDYAVLHETWLAAGKPGQELETRISGQPITFKVLYEAYSEPTFLWPHGYVLVEWAQRMAHALIAGGKRITVVEGGTGASKTSSVGIMALSLAALIPGFDFLNVAPTASQAQDMLDELEKWTTGSEFERFIVKPVSGRLFKLKPFPILTVQVGDAPRSTLGCMTLGIHGNWILGKDKDWLNVDEAGLVQGIGEAIPRLVTRLRGVRRTGRPRWAAMSFITNPHLNPSFDRLRKRAEAKAGEEDSLYFTAHPVTSDNTAITARQLRLQCELLDPADQGRWLRGERTSIDIEGELPPVLIENCHNPGLDAIMEEAVIRGQPDTTFEKRDGIGIVHWQLPYDPDRAYIAVGDPGMAAPRKMNINNVPVVLVFDITEYPAKPATLRAFHWIDGGGTYGPWKSCMQEMMVTYKCLGCYDGTGTQASFAQSEDFQGFDLWPISLGGGVKVLAKTFFKLMCGDGFYAWPYLEGLWYQASVYREFGPGVKKIPDDIISTMFVLSYFLRLLYLSDLPKKYSPPGEEKDETEKIMAEAALRHAEQRYARTGGRYGRQR